MNLSCDLPTQKAEGWFKMLMNEGFEIFQPFQNLSTSESYQMNHTADDSYGTKIISTNTDQASPKIDIHIRTRGNI